MPAIRFLSAILLVSSLILVGSPTAVQGSLGDVAPVQAVTRTGFEDLDKDMVPDCIEHLMLTDPSKADSDGDGIDDFEEILTFTSHNRFINAKPVDYAMRVLTTSSLDPARNGEIYLHIMIRFVNVKLQNVVIRELYADQGGKRSSLLNLVGHGTRVTQRQRARDGSSFLFSFRLASESDLRRILPCTLGVMAVLDGQYKNTGTYLMQAGPDVAALMPFSETSLALMPVSTGTMLQDESPYYGGGGRVCEMQLKRTGAGSSVAEVTKADCRAAPGLRCSLTCPKKVGTVVTIPDGPSTITGG